MEASNRLELAIIKLYRAFYNGTLNPECCKQCAVGNILNNTDSWKHLSDNHGSSQLNYVGRVNEAFGKRFMGYTPSELLQIEIAFLEGCGYKVPLSRGSSNNVVKSERDLFDGLSAVISFLCKLDGIDNVMDYTALFDLKGPAKVKDKFKTTSDILS